MIQYFSDLHTEEYKSNPKKLFRKIQASMKHCAPYLIIAGDIGDPYSKIYADVLQYLSKQFNHIFIIAGNHEYYGSNTMQMVQDQIRVVISSIKNITYLENEIYCIPNSDICVFGATFWSDIKKEEESDIIHSIADYKFIPKFTPEQSRTLYKTSCEKLKESMEKYPSKKFIVVSHHLPSYSLINQKYLSQKSINSAFASEISEANSLQIVAWIAGHTHMPVQCGKFFVNPIGYKGENMKYDFNRVILLKS